MKKVSEISSYNRAVGKNIKRARERVDLFQRQVADMLKVDRTTYVRYEMGSLEMGYVRLRNFSKITRTSIDKLLEVVDEC